MGEKFPKWLMKWVKRRWEVTVALHELSQRTLKDDFSITYILWIVSHPCSKTLLHAPIVKSSSLFQSTEVPLQLSQVYPFFIPLAFYSILTIQLCALWITQSTPLNLSPSESSAMSSIPSWFESTKHTEWWPLAAARCMAVDPKRTQYSQDITNVISHNIGVRCTVINCDIDEIRLNILQKRSPK